MFESNLILYIIAEIAAFLLVLCVFLALHIRSLKGLVTRLEDKVKTLRASLKKTKRDTRQVMDRLKAEVRARPAVKTYNEYLSDQINATRQHHQSLDPDRDIVLDMADDAPGERQVAALRHTFLIAEQEALYAGAEGVPVWSVLQGKLEKLIEFYRSPGDKAVTTAESDATDAEADISGDTDLQLQNYLQRIENLEKFKKLFFQMEDKWNQSRAEAEGYHQQLLAMSQQFESSDDFETLLNSYGEAFREVGDLIEGGVSDGSFDDRSLHGQAAPHGAGKIIINNQEEMARLRNMAVDQHKVIEQLKKKLVGAKSAEEQQNVIADLTSQLDRQQRFLQESDTCTRLLEDELNRLSEENEKIRSELDQNTGIDQENLGQLESVTEKLTEESKEMLSTIAALEEENRNLLEKLNAGTSAGVAGDTGEMQKRMTEMQQELLNLQTQHIELEERYIELKTQTV